MRSVYETTVSIPLSVVLAPNRHVDSFIPSTLTYKIRSSGWHLLNLLYINKNSQCILDASKVSLNDSINHVVNKQELVQRLITPVSVDVLDVLPSQISFSTGAVAIKKIPVKMQNIVSCKEGYMLTSMQVQPDSIVIQGAKRVVEGIYQWKTKPVSMQQLSENTTIAIPLSDSLNNIVQIAPQQVRVQVGVQRIAEITISDIPVRIENNLVTQQHMIVPQTVSVTVRGGIETISNLSVESFNATVSQNSITSDSTGVLKPRIEVPKNVQLLSVNPPTLMHRTVVVKR